MFIKTLLTMHPIGKSRNDFIIKSGVSLFIWSLFLNLSVNYRIFPVGFLKIVLQYQQQK